MHLDNMLEWFRGEQSPEYAQTGILTAELLGDPVFRRDHRTRYAYVVGSMYRGISSVEMVVRLGQAGILSFFGTGGLKFERVEAAMQRIQTVLTAGQPYGMNLLRDEGHPDREEDMVDLFLNYGITRIEASAFMYVTAALVKFRAAGLSRNIDGKIVVANHIMAKLSRPEVAQAFLSPAPEALVQELLKRNAISAEQAQMLSTIPMADDICVETDSGGHTDGSSTFAVFPTMSRLRDRAMKTYAYEKKIRVGAAGGIGTPEAAAAAFLLGADFILTGSINQCSVEADTSDLVKDLLQAAHIQDTVYAPAGDIFETGAKVQVLNRGLLFPARANKLYNLYCHYNSLEEIEQSTCDEIQERYLKRSFDEVYDDIKAYYPAAFIRNVERNPKHKMALIFRSYMRLSNKLAIDGEPGRRVDYQIHCGPAMGAFNQWVKGAPLEDWRNRHVDDISVLLLRETARFLNQRMDTFTRAAQE
ncbi:MAG: PfaD family polyunsaturated fatty acid/polyketide biosynthesis protein [Ectothiorhodospiraceae bacterium]|nr:PfaD family polyunsaturated fatty acid/polyketide biosynthesis protein [Ectothiorhodospiraceae bacterium]